MPEPELAAEGEQGVQAATTPQSADKPETTTQAEGTQSDFDSVADLLDIPEDLKQQIAPKAQTEVKPDEKPETPDTEAEPEGEPEVKAEEKEKEEEDEEESEEEESEEEEKPAQKIDKRQKRINRLTRQRSQLEKQLEERDGKIEELSEKLSKFEKNGQAPVATIPQVGAWMPSKEVAEEYSELSQKKEAAKATIKWCDRNKDGVQVVRDGQQVFMDADEIATYRQEAQEKLLEIAPDIAVLERTAKQEFRKQKGDYDKIAYTFWPDLANKRSELYQEANAIKAEFPTVAASPAADYYIGLAIEGRKSLEAKIAAAKNGNGKSPQKPKGDIDPKVFTTPRVPIAPHTAEPPTREYAIVSKKNQRGKRQANGRSRRERRISCSVISGEGRSGY